VSAAPPAPCSSIKCRRRRKETHYELLVFQSCSPARCITLKFQICNCLFAICHLPSAICHFLFSIFYSGVRAIHPIRPSPSLSTLNYQPSTNRMKLFGLRTSRPASGTLLLIRRPPNVVNVPPEKSPRRVGLLRQPLQRPIKTPHGASHRKWSLVELEHRSGAQHIQQNQNGKRPQDFEPTCSARVASQLTLFFFHAPSLPLQPQY
jgi:hypothetical protein